MHSPKLAIMLEDNHQTTRRAKEIALQTRWKTVESWTEIEKEISSGGSEL